MWQWYVLRDVSQRIYEYLFLCVFEIGRYKFDCEYERTNAMIKNPRIFEIKIRY